MQDESVTKETLPKGSAAAETPAPLPHRALAWTLRMWRTGATAVFVVLAVLIGWHVVNGKHGLSVWQQKHLEDRQLQKEIDQLQQENARLRVRVVKLTSDPHAIEHEAREKLRYAKQGEVIVDLSSERAPQTKPAAK